MLLKKETTPKQEAAQQDVVEFLFGVVWGSGLWFGFFFPFIGTFSPFHFSLKKKKKTENWIILLKKPHGFVGKEFMLRVTQTISQKTKAEHVHVTPPHLF